MSSLPVMLLQTLLLTPLLTVIQFGLNKRTNHPIILGQNETDLEEEGEEAAGEDDAIVAADNGGIAKYKQDLKMEAITLKNALKLSKAKTPALDPQPRQKTPQELKEEKRLRKEEIERKIRSVKESLPLLFD
jgi:hypothetical protein